MEQRVLVTGGAGFIGSHVVQELLNADVTVQVVDNLFAGDESLAPEGASLDEIDILDEGLHSVVQAFNPTDIIHLAAIHYIPYCNDHPEEAFNVNVMGTRNLLDAARELDGLETIVYASSAAVYPPRGEANAENSETGPVDIYGRTKLVGEDLVELFHEETGVKVRSARLFNVYGPDETNPHLIPAVVEQITQSDDDTSSGAVGPPIENDRKIELGNLTPRRDFVHVTDVARALAVMIGVRRTRSTAQTASRVSSDVPEGYRTYNVGTGTAHSVQQVAELATEPLERKWAITQAQDRVRQSDRPHLEADITRIRSELKWEPTVKFADGLHRLLSKERQR